MARCLYAIANAHTNLPSGELISFDPESEKINQSFND